MGEKTKKPHSPLFFIVIGLIYAINPFDVPGPIDDMIVNIITSGLALHAMLVCKKIDKVVEDKTGVKIDSKSVIHDTIKESGNHVDTDAKRKSKSTLDKMEEIFTNATK